MFTMQIVLRNFWPRAMLPKDSYRRTTRVFSIRSSKLNRLGPDHSGVQLAANSSELINTNTNCTGASDWGKR